MTHIRVLTPDPTDQSFSGQWPGVLRRLEESLKLAGVQVVPTPWTEHVDDASGLIDAPLVLPLLVWGYHRDHDRWMRATRTWADAGVKLLNPAHVLGWNSDKSYLRRLAEAGVDILPTVWIERAGSIDLGGAFDRLGTETVVVKPRVSGGAWSTVRLKRGQPLDGMCDGPAMIQAYLPSIETDGETSLLFFGGRFSHAVCKRPPPGDFRIQVQFGGRYEPTQPPAQAFQLADRTLAAIGEDLLYARIDMARDAAGDWRLMEAELIEPDFYLRHAPDGGRMFAEAVRARLSLA